MNCETHFFWKNDKLQRYMKMMEINERKERKRSKSKENVIYQKTLVTNRKSKKLTIN